MNDTNIYVKSFDKAGQYIEGVLVKVGNNYFIQNSSELVENDICVGFINSYIEVNPHTCARKLCELPNKSSIFEFDIFSTQNGELFYVSFDYNRLAITYTAMDGIDLPDNINIFDCTLVGNYILNN